LGILSEAVAYEEEVVRVTPLDMNVVYQQLELEPNRDFDLVIGTNSFVYYGIFEQTLARRNIGRC
jgi:hypothetical protein